MNPVQRSRQRGSTSVLAAFALVLALACLMVLDIAHVFTVKRELQKVADLAALAGAAVTSDCGGMQDRARGSAAANGHARPAPDFVAECGDWTLEDGFTPSASSTGALRATAARDVPYFFAVGGRRVEAQAIARSRATAAFALGTGLAEVDAGALNALLGAALRTQVKLTAASWQGLAAGRLSLLDLLQTRVLRVGTVEELLSTELRMADFVLAMARAIAPDSPLEATALQDLAAGIPHGLVLRLGELLQTDLADGNAGASVQLNALQILNGAAQLANKGQLLDLGTSLTVPGLAQVAVKLAVIEPPRLAVGREGARARSGQVQLQLLAQVGIELPAGIASLTALRLPLRVDVAPANATLTGLECAPSEADCAVSFQVASGLAQACLGEPGGAGSTPTCAPATVLGVKLLNLVELGVQVGAGASVPVAADSVRFGHGGFPGSSVTDSRWRGSVGAGGAGTLLANLLGGLQVQLDPKGLLGLSSLVNALIAPLLGPLLAAVKGVVTGALTPLLDGAVTPLLQALGITVGLADLHQVSLDCRAVELVR